MEMDAGKNQEDFTIIKWIVVVKKSGSKRRCGIKLIISLLTGTWASSQDFVLREEYLEY